jgi:hypothetical protein
MSNKKIPRASRKTIVALIGAIIFIAILVALQSVYTTNIKTFPDIVVNRSFIRTSDLFYDYEINRYPSAAEIVELNQEKTIIGFDVDPTKLNFGMIPINGSYSRKTVNLTNMVDRGAKIYLDAYGNIRPYVSFGESRITLRKGESREIEIIFNSKTENLTAPLGNYTGEIDIVTQVPKYNFIYALWGL